MDDPAAPKVPKARSGGAWQGILHRALPGFRCGACGEKDWDFLGPDQSDRDLVGVLHLVDWQAERLAGVIHTVAFGCRRCGKVELFATPYLLERAEAGDG